jgi:N-acetylglucosamine repressor
VEKATQQHIKELNRNLVLKILFERSTTSRAEIARISNLTRTTVSDIIAGLIEEGLVSEIGTGSSMGGKSPILLRLEPDSRHMISLNLGQNEFMGAVVNLRGEIREMTTRPVEGRDGEKALKTVCAVIDELIRKTERPLVGISLGTPGLVNTREGIVINSVNMDWRNFPLGPRLRERFSMPVFVLNDCQAAAMGEYKYQGDEQHTPNMIVVMAGHGIGAGIIINGEIFQGDGGYAGEIGHIVTVRENGLLCRCGNRGCLETVASARAVIQSAESQAMVTPESVLNKQVGRITLEVLEKAFDAGDDLARQIIIHAGHALGEAVASLAGGLNIDKVILTGMMTRFGQNYLEAVQEKAGKNILPRLRQEISVELGHHRDNEIILGASAYLASDYSLLLKPVGARNNLWEKEIWQGNSL